MEENCETYLGFDLSTQKLKAVQLRANMEVVAIAEVKFDADLPEFRTTGGVTAGLEKNEFFVQPVMWIKAIDIVLDRLVVQGADLSTVAAIGGSAQQHGSLYWSKNGVETLKTLDPDKFLHLQIDDSAFMLTRTPVWMDGSTEKQCLEMETAIGGRLEMIAITGSKCYPRFTGPQIRKIYQKHSHIYEDTKRISLVSSFLASLFVGKVVGIDYSDASGMNLFDINYKDWSKACLNACAPELETRLGAPVKTMNVVGTISDFFAKRFGIPSNCIVSAFTGDNPSALSGMLTQQDWLVMSLGTSDTIMMNLDKPRRLEEGHVLCHPFEPNQYMGLLCFRNGSLVRDNFKKVEANNNWNLFNELLDSTPRGNFGNMALHFHTKEIIPNAKGSLRWTKNLNASSPDAAGVVKFSSSQIEIRALIEGQMIHRRAVVEEMGFNFGEKTKIIATGGASSNKSILQVISDVFNAPVYVQKNSEAALLGSAYRARYVEFLYQRNKKANVGYSNNELETCSIPTYRDYILQLIPNHLQKVCDPSRDSDSIYPCMLQRYREMVGILEQRK